MRNKQLLQLAIAAILIISCNDSNDKNAGDKSTNDSGQVNTKTPDATNKSVRADIDVTITGGDYNGTYSAECRDACCSWGIAGEKVFGNQYSENGKGDKELSSVQLVVNDVSEGNKSTKEFMVTVSFGKLFEGKSFNINTMDGKNQGSGTLDLQYSGNKATVKIKGVSAEGPAIDLTMQCNKVLTTGNLGDDL
jgi:hypothetical protein